MNSNLSTLHYHAPLNAKLSSHDRAVCPSVHRHKTAERLFQICIPYETRPKWDILVYKLKRFPSYSPLWDLEYFPDIMCVRENSTSSHTGYLNLYNSKIWRATLIIFSVFLHRNTVYEKLAWNPQHDASFPRRVSVKTPTFTTRKKTGRS